MRERLASKNTCPKKSDFENAVEDMEAAEKRRLQKAERDRIRAKLEQERLELAKKEQLRLEAEEREKFLKEQHLADVEATAPFISLLNQFGEELNVNIKEREDYLERLRAERERFETERRLWRQRKSVG